MITGLIIAHRGESFDAPENTLASVKLAWERGARAVEIDIRLTKDNEVVVIHDKDTLRISGEKKVISKSSVKELKLLNAGYHKSGEWSGVRIPTLGEVLSTVPDDGKLIIEIKDSNNILPKLFDVLSKSDLKAEQIEIIAFNEKTLAKAKQLMPQYRMLWLLNLDYALPKWLLNYNSEKVIKQVKELKLDGVNVWAGKLLTKDFISEYKKAGLLVYSWTVDNKEKIEELIKNGADGVTTNRAGWILQQLKNTYF